MVRPSIGLVSVKTEDAQALPMTHGASELRPGTRRAQPPDGTPDPADMAAIEFTPANGDTAPSVMDRRGRSSRESGIR